MIHKKLWQISKECTHKQPQTGRLQYQGMYFLTIWSQPFSKNVFLFQNKTAAATTQHLFSVNDRADLFINLDWIFVINTGHWNRSLLTHVGNTGYIQRVWYKSWVQLLTLTLYNLAQSINLSMSHFLYLQKGDTIFCKTEFMWDHKVHCMQLLFLSLTITCSHFSKQQISLIIANLHTGQFEPYIRLI